MAPIGHPCTRTRVLVDINYLVEISRYNLGRSMEGLMIKVNLCRSLSTRRILSINGAICTTVGHNILGQADAGQIAHCYLIFVRVLNDFRAQIAALDRSEILLIALLVCSVLVEHIGRPSLDLGINNGTPQLSRSYLTNKLALGFILLIETLELLAMTLLQTLTLMRTHETPHAIVLNPFHEEIGHPKTIKEITCSLLFFAMVLLHIEHIEYVGMPRLQVNGERTGTLPSTLINVPGGHIVHTQHGDKTIRYATSSLDVRSTSTNVVHRQTNASGSLGDDGTLFQGVVDPIDTVVLHLHQKARR
mmetsp:Transcript_1961/g.5685  ORF Transcript_1961/g.5685 Transcript_1961/m.5685 type:complete len:304 (+) Transcript_1961:879-1790(+)